MILRSNTNHCIVSEKKLSNSYEFLFNSVTIIGEVHLGHFSLLSKILSPFNVKHFRNRLKSVSAGLYTPSYSVTFYLFRITLLAVKF